MQCKHIKSWYRSDYCNGTDEINNVGVKNTVYEIVKLRQYHTWHSPGVGITKLLSPFRYHYNDVTMGSMASQITSLTIVYSAVYSGADQRKHQSSASLAFVRGIHRRPVNSPYKWPVTRKMFPFVDVIMIFRNFQHRQNTFAIEYHVYIWHVPPQLSCVGTCQI